MTKTLGVIAVVCMAGAAVGAEKTAPAGPVALYAKNCQSCHAPDARGNPKMVKALKVQAADLDLLDEASLKDTVEAWARDVADGVKPKMPAYGKKLTAQQIKDLVAYIRGLVKPAK